MNNWRYTTGWLIGDTQRDGSLQAIGDTQRDGSLQAIGDTQQDGSLQAIIRYFLLFDRLILAIDQLNA